MTKIAFFLITVIVMVCIDLGHSKKKKKSELIKVSENCECYCPKSGKWKEMEHGSGGKWKEMGHGSGDEWGNSKSTTRYRVSKSKGSGGSYKIKRTRKTSFSHKKISKNQSKRIKFWSKKFKASKKKSKKFGHRSLGNSTLISVKHYIICSTNMARVHSITTWIK